MKISRFRLRDQTRRRKKNLPRMVRAHSMRGTHVTGGTVGGWSRKKKGSRVKLTCGYVWKEIHSSGRQRFQRTLFATPRPTPAASIKAESRFPNPPRPRPLCLSPLFHLPSSRIQHTHTHDLSFKRSARTP